MSWKSPYLWFVLANLSDLLITHVGLTIFGAGAEANPLGRWLWREFGFMGLLGLKVVLGGILLAACPLWVIWVVSGVVVWSGTFSWIEPLWHYYRSF